MKPLHILILPFLGVIFCGYPGEYVPVAAGDGTGIAGIELVLQPDSIYQNQSLQGKIRLILENGEKTDGDAAGATWESASPGIASAGPGGIITGVGEGSAEILAELDGKTASALINVMRIIDCSRVLLSEVFYDALGADTGLEFMEIHNAGIDACDISGYRITDGLKSSAPFIFPDNTFIASGEFAVIASSGPGFAGFFGHTPRFAGFSFSLNNSGEAVIFSAKDGTLQDILYLEGGYGDFLPGEEWGPAMEPWAAEGESVRRIDFTPGARSRFWARGTPTPGTD